AEASQVHWSAGRPGSAAAMDVAELTHEFEECVRLHLASDVPLGVFLSGGVDSSAVANLAQRSAGGSVHTFTLAFAEPEYNEGPVARRIAEAIGTQHQEVVLTEAEFTEGLQDALDSLDQPTFDGLNSYYLSLAIRRAGFTVALVGTGGDELFGGYASFRDLPVLQKWVRNLGWLPRPGLVGAAKVASAMLAPSRGGMPPQTRWAKLPEMVRNGDNLLSLYQLAYALFLPDFQRQLLGDVAGALQDGLPDRLRSRLLGEAAGRSTLSAISTMEQRLFLGERLLRDNDAASMAASIEQRLPLVDHVLFECMDRVADPQRYSPVGRKDLLRRIGLRGLDSALFDRPKSGFELPFDRWIRAGLSDVIDRTMRDASAARAVGLDPAAVQRLWVAFLDRAPGVYWTRVWAIFILIRWCHRHEVFA
ncbi:MAG TPA: asparagine synthase C-terminal domain-containing protein, partial [Anaeromyxobacteraceae bacterium]|nr:asparagine synthase C-terminal domain-containing protein [Anaeromyxobacteraceae bacterium]